MSRTTRWTFKSPPLTSPIHDPAPELQGNRSPDAAKVLDGNHPPDLGLFAAVVQVSRHRERNARLPPRLERDDDSGAEGAHLGLCRNEWKDLRIWTHWIHISNSEKGNKT